MPCNDENKEEEGRWDAVLDAEAALANARRKLENRLKASLAACGIGAFGAVAGSLPGLLAGGSACIAALLVADDAAGDYEVALANSELAHKRHLRALMAQFLCLSRCDLE